MQCTELDLWCTERCTELVMYQSKLFVPKWSCTEIGCTEMDMYRKYHVPNWTYRCGWNPVVHYTPLAAPQYQVRIKIICLRHIIHRIGNTGSGFSQLHLIEASVYRYGNVTHTSMVQTCIKV